MSCPIGLMDPFSCGYSQVTKAPATVAHIYAATRQLKQAQSHAQELVSTDCKYGVDMSHRDIMGNFTPLFVCSIFLNFLPILKLFTCHLKDKMLFQILVFNPKIFQLF